LVPQDVTLKELKTWSSSFRYHPSWSSGLSFSRSRFSAESVSSHGNELGGGCENIYRSEGNAQFQRG